MFEGRGSDQDIDLLAGDQRAADWQWQHGSVKAASYVDSLGTGTMDEEVQTLLARLHLGRAFMSNAAVWKQGSEGRDKHQVPAAAAI